MATETEKKAENTAKGFVKDVEAALVAEAHEVRAKVEAWFRKHFHNSRISQDEVSYNLAHAAKEDLKTIIAPLPAETAPAAPAVPTTTA